MAQTQIINKFGKLIGWLSATINMLGRDLEGITTISYSDEVKKENAYGAGRMPVGTTEGNYEAKASITMYKDEILALQQSLPPGMRIQDIPPFPIIVNYEQGDNVFKDIVQNCQFTGNQTELKQGEGKVEIQIELLCTHIEWYA